MIQKIRLQNFRNFKDKTLEFSSKINVIIGPNASGKTNLLESVFLLSTGKSFKAKIEEEMINYDSDLARVKAKGSFGLLEIILTRGKVKVGDSSLEKMTRKKMLVEGVARRLIDFSGNLKIVLFGPWDMDLVTESPSTRRRFLDNVLSQVDREYRRAILSYEKGLRQRNRLLWRIREERLSRSQLTFWDKLLIKNGDYISKKREEFIEFINKTPDLNQEKYNLVYDKSAISEGRLNEYQEEEVMAGVTLVGPHRDDFLFQENGKDLARYGSRGESRMGILWLKIAELAFIEEISKVKPVFLLDDIFSELDEKHKEIVVKKILTGGQSIITTAEPNLPLDLEDHEKIVF